MLEPQQFGQIAFAVSFVMFFNAFTNWHGDKFAIWSNDDHHKMLNVAFTMELCMSIVMAAAAFFIAPLVMEWLGKDELTIYAQFMALAFFYNPFSRPRALLERELKFVQSKIPFLVSQALSAVIAVAMAYQGYGIWSLIAWRLSNLFVETTLLWMLCRNRPRLCWDAGVLKQLVVYSGPLMGSAFLTYLCYNIDYLIVGVVLENGEEQLGFYWLGFQAGAYFLVMRQIFYNVLFPLFSRSKDDVVKEKIFSKLTISVGGAFLLPALLAIFFAPELILLAFGPKWGPAIAPFQILMFTFLSRAISANAGYYLYSKGLTQVEFNVVLMNVVLLAPLAFGLTLTNGIVGASIAVCLAHTATILYSFERYIKPLTQKGVFAYFGWPWAFALIAMIVSNVCDSLGRPLFLLCICFAVLLLAAYIIVWRPIVNDITRLARLLRTSSGEC